MKTISFQIEGGILFDRFKKTHQSEAKKYKIGAIVQQGGSISDQKVIEKANELGIPMVFTDKRAFWN